MSHVNKKITSERGRDLSLVFYDCTNFYYETVLDDAEKREIGTGNIT